MALVTPLFWRNGNFFEDVFPAAEILRAAFDHVRVANWVRTVFYQNVVMSKLTEHAYTASTVEYSEAAS